MSADNNKRTKKLSYKELGSFFENMGMLIRSGISETEAVSLLSEDTDSADRNMNSAMNSLASSMSEGMTLEQAMRASGAFPDYAVDMVSTSEYTGMSEKTYFHLSDYYRTENSMKNTLASAVRYPMILLIMIIAVLALMLALVFPAFYGVYNNLTGDLASSSFSHINFSFTVCEVMLVLMILIVVAMFAGVYMWRNGKKDSVRNILSKVPTFKELFEKLDLYRFTSCFEMFLASGEHQDEAIKKSVSVVEGSQLKEKLKRCADKMEAGQSFAQVANEEKLYGHTSNRMLIPAERSGMLDEIMSKIMINLQDAIDSLVSRIANTTEPLLTGVLMIFIGIMLISLMVPLIGVMNSIG